MSTAKRCGDLEPWQPCSTVQTWLLSLLMTGRNLLCPLSGEPIDGEVVNEGALMSDSRTPKQSQILAVIDGHGARALPQHPQAGP